nr:unnamed protein product [Digitaria exilis]
MEQATPGDGGLVAAPAFNPEVDESLTDGGLDAEVSLSLGKQRRSGVGRRLTLAPAPAKLGVPKVANSDGSLVDLSGARSADPLAGLRPRAYGSKFWPLADELSSEDEEEDGGMVSIPWAVLS